MCASRLLGMGGDSFANAKSGVGDVGRLLLLACMGGCLTIFTTFLSCILSGGVSHCFSGPRVIGLIEWLCLLVFFWCSEVLVLWELELLYEMSVECEGRFEMAAGCHGRNWT